MEHVFSIHTEYGRFFNEGIYKRELANRLDMVSLEVPMDVSFRDFNSDAFEASAPASSTQCNSVGEYYERMCDIEHNLEIDHLDCDVWLFTCHKTESVTSGNAREQVFSIVERPSVESLRTQRNLLK